MERELVQDEVAGKAARRARVRCEDLDAACLALDLDRHLEAHVGIFHRVVGRGEADGLLRDAEEIQHLAALERKFRAVIL